MKNSKISLFELTSRIAASLDIQMPPMSCAADIMTRDIKFLTLDNTVRDFLEFIKENKVRHAPVIDITNTPEPKTFFVGILSERDALRFTLPYTEKFATQPEHKKVMRKLLVQFVTRKPISASPQTPVSKLISVMIKKHIDMVPVLDENALVGIITTTDILKLLLTFHALIQTISADHKTGSQADLHTLTAWTHSRASDIMTQNPLTMGLKDTLADAMNTLQEKGFRHIMVVDKNQRLTGIVSDRDILRHLPYTQKNTAPASMDHSFRNRLFRISPDTPGLEIPLAHVMEWELTTISPDTSLSDAAKKLSSQKLSCLPVLNNEEKLTGLITVTDLMQTLIKIYK